jgi:hypothetical protein
MIWQLSDHPISEKMEQLFLDVAGSRSSPLPEPARTLSCLLELVSDCLIDVVGIEQAAEMLEKRWPEFIDEQHEIINRLRHNPNT